jgi:hypothetical protein
MLGNLLGGFIVILVGVNLIGEVADNVAYAQRNDGSSAVVNISTTSPTASTILGLTTIFFALGIMASGVGLAVGGLRNAGLV